MELVAKSELSDIKLFGRGHINTFIKLKLSYCMMHWSGQGQGWFKKFPGHV